MRATSEAPAGASVDEELPNVLYSPSVGSTTTGMSGASSLGLQYKGGWCTPPRVFIDYQVPIHVSTSTCCISFSYRQMSVFKLTHSTIYLCSGCLVE